jgi:hypothetical protein
MKPLVFATSVACLIGGLCSALPAQAAAGQGTVVAQLDEHVGQGRDRWREHRREHCREVTIRERHGDDVVVRHIRRCD